MGEAAAAVAADAARLHAAADDVQQTELNPTATSLEFDNAWGAEVVVQACC